MNLTELVHHAHAETGASKSSILEAARRNWPSTREFKPVQVALLVRLLQKRAS